MEGQQGRLHGPAAGIAAGQGTDAGGMHAESLAEQQREEQVSLVAERHPGQPSAGPSLGGGEGQHLHRDVGVRAFGVRVSVMAVVLADPPAITQPDAEIANQDAEDVAGSPGARNLPVPGVVAQKPGLGKHHRQERGHRKLPPRVSHQDEDSPSGGQQRGRDRDLPDVAPGPPFQQPRLLDLMGQLRVVAPPLRCGRCSRRRERPDRPPGRSSRLFVGSHRGSSWDAHRGRAGDVPPGS